MAIASVVILLCPLLSAQVPALSVPVTELPEAPQQQPKNYFNAPEGNALQATESSSLRSGRSGGESSATTRLVPLGRKFVLLQVALAAATVADAETTLYGLRHNLAREGNPIFGPNPSRARIYGTVVPVTAFVILLDYRQKRDNPHGRWQIVPAIFTAAHTLATVHNLRTIAK